MACIATKSLKAPQWCPRRAAPTTRHSVRLAAARQTPEVTLRGAAAATLSAALLLGNAGHAFAGAVIPVDTPDVKAASIDLTTATAGPTKLTGPWYFEVSCGAQELPEIPTEENAARQKAIATRTDDKMFRALDAYFLIGKCEKAPVVMMRACPKWPCPYP